MATRSRSSRTKSTSSNQTVKLDLRTTERGKKGGYRYPEAEYKVKITKAERKTSQSGNTQIVLNLEILAPEKYAGKPLIDRLTLTEKAMFRVGWLLDAVGIKWKNAVLDFPLSKLVDEELGVQLYDDEYNGRVSSKVAEYYSAEEVDDLIAGTDDDEEEDDDDEDEDEVDDLDDLDRDELKKLAKEKNIKVKKSMSDDDIRELLTEEEDDDDEDLDELDDDEL